MVTTLAVNLQNQRTLSSIVGPVADNDDEIFQRDLQEMEMASEQVEADCRYFESTLERADEILKAAAARLDVANSVVESHELRLTGLHTGAVIASLALIFAVEIMRETHYLIDHPQTSINALLLTLIGTLALTQMAFSWRRIRWPTPRVLFGATVGLAGTTVLSVNPGVSTQLGAYIPVATLLFGILYLLGNNGYRLAEELFRLREDARDVELASQASAFEKLRLAAAEMDEGSA